MVWNLGFNTDTPDAIYQCQVHVNKLNRRDDEMKIATRRTGFYLKVSYIFENEPCSWFSFIRKLYKIFSLRECCDIGVWYIYSVIFSSFSIYRQKIHNTSFSVPEIWAGSACRFLSPEIFVEFANFIMADLKKVSPWNDWHNLFSPSSTAEKLKRFEQATEYICRQVKLKVIDENTIVWKVIKFET